MKGSPRIVFFGTPEFAVESLQAILQAGFEVAAVVTAPDKPAGRGLKLSPSPVKLYALSRDISVLQPVHLKSQDFIKDLAALNADLFVVVAFRILPREIWGMPSLGTFNLHASLLPQYRGAAPINWAIINGESETGVTTFFINDQIDTGEILLQEKVSIGRDETAGDLHDRLMNIGAELVVRTIRQISGGGAMPVSQEILIANDLNLKPAPKLQKLDFRIEWNDDVAHVYNRIRGLSPYPGAYAEIPLADGSHLKIRILAAIPEPCQGSADLYPGKVITDRKRFLKVFSMNGFIRIVTLQPSAGKPMDIRDFLNGHGKLLP
ncbi:MAG: methionyl-tRNA formyltransferase [bacterium]